VERSTVSEEWWAEAGPFPDSADLVVTNATAILGGVGDEQYRVVPDTAIVVSDGSIAWIGASADSKPLPGARAIDAQGRLAVPGLISTHNHLFQNLCKGLGDEMGVWEIVTCVILATAEDMSADDLYTGALAALVEGVRSGRTAVFEFTVGLPDIEHQRAIVRAFEDSGVRGILGRATREVYVESQHRDPWLLPIEEVLDQMKQLSNEFENGLPGPSAVPAPGTAHTMTLAGLEKVKEWLVAEGGQTTMHLYEYEEEPQEGVERWGAPTLAKLEQIGFLGPDVVAAHSVLMSRSDLEILARTGTQVSYNPVSNCYCAVGIPPIVPMLEMGIDVSLAVDGAAVNNQNMIESMKVGALLQKIAYSDPQAMNARDVLALATYGGAKSLGAPDLLGALEVGRLADFFLFDHVQINTSPGIDPISALVYMGNPENVHTVVVGGEILLEDGKSTRVDEQALAQELRERAIALAARSGTARYARGRKRTPFRLYEPHIPHLHPNAKVGA
jgi:5-methylthioadenosine/S-adenosylhomocysteine deaminase